MEGGGIGNVGSYFRFGLESLNETLCPCFLSMNRRHLSKLFVPGGGRSQRSSVRGVRYFLLKLVKRRMIPKIPTRMLCDRMV